MIIAIRDFIKKQGDNKYLLFFIVSYLLINSKNKDLVLIKLLFF